MIKDLESPETIQLRVLTVVLGAVSPDVRFGRGKYNLDSRLYSILRPETAPIITDNFTFHPKYGTSKEIEWLLSSQVEYGAALGLENNGPDHIYEITQRTRRLAREIKERGLLDKREIDYLESLGRRLG